MNSIVAQSILGQIDQEAVEQRKDLLRVATDIPTTTRGARGTRTEEGVVIRAYTAGLLRAMRIVADQSGIKLQL